MADPRVTILKRDGDQSAEFSNYEDARISSVAGDLIMIRADLVEQILLKDSVDIFIMPGVSISFSSDDTIVDNDLNYDDPVNCNIYGLGVIKNTGSGSCIRVKNPGSKLTVECDYIQNVNGVAVNISPSLKFHLKCNYVYSQNLQAIRIGNFAAAGMVNEVKLDVIKVETGVVNSPSTGTTALSTRGNGFVRIDEIICNNLGHCLSHQEGTITARIKKMTSIMNRSGGNVSTVHLAANQGSTGQKLILYFDEINCLNGATNNALCGIECTIGTGIFIGRRVYSEIISSLDGAAIQIGNANTKGFVKCDEIVSKNNSALVLNEFTNEILVIANYIEGNKTGDGGVIFSFDGANFMLKNSTVKNVNSGSSVKGIGLFKGTNNPNVKLKNVKIISNGSTIFYNISSPNIEVTNYNLFVNDPIGSNADLLIGIKNEMDPDYNFLYIEDPDL